MKTAGRSGQIWRKVLGQTGAVQDEKKQRIVEAVVCLIAERGVEAVTFEEIGRRLGTTKANIKYHFANKDDLIFTAGRLVVSNAQTITAAAVEEAATPEMKLKAMIDGAYEWYANFPDHVRVWIFFVYYAHVREAYAQFYRDTRAAGQRRLQLILQALPRSPQSGQPPFAALASTVQNLLYGQLIGLGGQTKELRESRIMAELLVRQLLASKGIRWSG